jgi:hypothetical protein
VRRWAIVVGLLVIALCAMADDYPGTIRPARTVKKIAVVGQLGNVHLDTIDCRGARQIVSWVRFASANSCTLATFLFSTNDSTFTAGANAVVVDSLSGKTNTNAVGPKPISAFVGDAGNMGGMLRSLYKSALLRITRRSTGNKGDSATVTQLDTAYVFTRVYY